MTSTNTITHLAGTALGAIDGEYVYLTKRVRVPRENILAVRPARDGRGAFVVTDRGSMRVCEDYGALMYHLYGAEVPSRGSLVGANVGDALDRATQGGEARQ